MNHRQTSRPATTTTTTIADHVEQAERPVLRQEEDSMRCRTLHGALPPPFPPRLSFLSSNDERETNAMLSLYLGRKGSHQGQWPAALSGRAPGSTIQGMAASRTCNLQLEHSSLRDRWGSRKLMVTKSLPRFTSLYWSSALINLPMSISGCPSRVVAILPKFTLCAKRYVFLDFLTVSARPGFAETTRMAWSGLVLWLVLFPPSPTLGKYALCAGTWC